MAGVICGLVTAVCQAVAYLLSRRYVVARHQSVLRLMVIGHALLGLACAAALPVLVDLDELPPVRGYAVDLLGAAGYYFVGQVGLFAALRWMDASRVAPLLGLKVVFVAVVAMVLLGQRIGPVQWVAIGVACMAAAMLNNTGGRLPRRVMWAVLAACLLFSLSDVHTKKTIDALYVLGPVRGPITAALLNYVLCGMMSAALLPWHGSRRVGDWAAAVPWVLTWLCAVLLLFISYAYAGIVLAGIAMATRGLWSIALGAAVSKAGWLHLEQRVPRGALARRAVAAVMMIVAIGLYAAAEMRR